MSQEIKEIKRCGGATIKTNIFPLTIELNKEYFRERFEKVFKKWDYNLGLGFDMYKEKEFFEDLMKCFAEDGE